MTGGIGDKRCRGHAGLGVDFKDRDAVMGRVITEIGACNPATAQRTIGLFGAILNFGAKVAGDIGRDDMFRAARDIF